MFISSGEIYENLEVLFLVTKITMKVQANLWKPPCYAMYYCLFVHLHNNLQ